ncbi:MAG: peptidylprolyl isomerase [Filifactoraceae bacterium]
MKRKQKILSLITGGILCLTIVSGCSNSSNNSAGNALEPYFSASENNPLKDLEYVVKIDDYLVSPDEYRYVYENSKAKYAYYSGGEDIFANNKDLIKQVKDDALSTLQYNVATMKFAKEKKIELSSDDMEKVKSEINDSVKQLGKENFDKALAESYLTTDLYNYVVKQGVLKEKVYSKLFTGSGEYSISESDLLKASKDYIHAKHILIKVDNEDWAAGEAKANEVYKKAVAGEDFDSLVKEFGQDPGMEQSPDGYYFKEGQMVENFYNGAKALDINQISKPIKTNYGYHIILRLPIEDKYVKEHSDIFVSEQQFDKFYSMLEDYKLKQTVSYDKIYDTISVDTFSKEKK